MDPVIKSWMFNNWIEDFADEYKLLENQGYLIGSFTNPEAVKRMLGKGSETFVSDDEEFDKFSEELLEKNRQEMELENKQIRKRKRKFKE